MDRQKCENGAFCFLQTQIGELGELFELFWHTQKKIEKKRGVYQE